MKEKTDTEEPVLLYQILLCPFTLFFKLRGSDLVVQGFDHAKVKFRNEPRHIGEVEQRNDAWNPCPEKEEHRHCGLAFAEISPL